MLFIWKQLILSELELQPELRFSFESSNLVDQRIDSLLENLNEAWFEILFIAQKFHMRALVNGFCECGSSVCETIRRLVFQNFSEILQEPTQGTVIKPAQSERH